jgi:hypothetical protein
MKKYFCDVCGVEITEKDSYAIDHGKVDDTHDGNLQASVMESEDTCSSCYKKFKKFLKGDKT